MGEISIYYTYRRKRPGHQEQMCVISMAGGGLEGGGAGARDGGW